MTFHLHRALVAAALLDLHQNGHILRCVTKVSGTDYISVSYGLSHSLTRTGCFYLDHVWTTIGAITSGDNRYSFAGLAVRYLDHVSPNPLRVGEAHFRQQKRVATDLIRSGALVAGKTSIAGLFPRSAIFPGECDTGEDSLRYRLQAVADRDASLPDEPGFLALLLLIQATGLAKDVWRENSDIAEWRVSKVLRLVKESHSVWADANHFIRYGANQNDYGLRSRLSC